ncbi:MAG: peptidoglycan editing factor PgeF [Malikia sp.]|nr:peptidoglycan editing factor PgeF [Malikia sp.]MDD2730399.1 peptidoglycan editing factor PgeF [Malikia sp.]
MGADGCWPAGAQAAMSTRMDGVSRPPFDSWNLGDHVGDAPQAVAANRELLGQRLGARPVFLRQVHGVEVLELGRDSPDGMEADACWSRQPGVACTVMVADCLPLLLCAPDASSVAAVHAGWRGLLGFGGRGVLEALCEAWPAARTRSQREGLRVWLGPCIGPLAFEVGPEVARAFMAADPESASAFSLLPGRSDGKRLADLPALARMRLRRLGIELITGNDGSAGWCTVTQASRFFSHRRDAASLGSTGRMAASIWRD